jgi:hypothetical protein
LAALPLAPGQASALKLENIRSTYGIQGPARVEQKSVKPGGK